MSDPDTTTPESAPAEAPAATEQAATATAPTPAPAVEAKNGFWWGTGRRKASVARVRIKPGNGAFMINGRKVDRFFTKPQDIADMWAPLEITKTRGKIDIYVRVGGGGTTGQAGAIRLGVSRALKTYDSGLESALRDSGFLTRDAREVERKKYGQPGARRRFQFSKR